MSMKNINTINIIFWNNQTQMQANETKKSAAKTLEKVWETTD